MQLFRWLRQLKALSALVRSTIAPRVLFVISRAATWLKTVGANSRIRGGRITIEAAALMRPPLPLNNITTASLQAMISQAVENVIASVKNL